MLASHLSAWAVRCLDAGFSLLLLQLLLLMVDLCCRRDVFYTCELPRPRSNLAVPSSPLQLCSGPCFCSFLGVIVSVDVVATDPSVFQRVRRASGL